MFAAIAIERYIGIIYPLHYDMLVTQHNLVMVICFAWLYSFLFALPAMVGAVTYETGELCYTFIIYSDIYIYIISAHMLIYIIVMVAIYIIIFHSIQRNQRRISAISTEIGPGQISHKNLLILKSFAMVVGVFVICWLPAAIINILGASLDDTLWLQDAFSFARFLRLTNSAVNPFIYALRLKSFRRPMLHMLRCRWQPRGSVLSLQPSQDSLDLQSYDVP